MADPQRARPAIRRDADGTTSIGRDWESLTERLIREAQEAGAFDDLPGTGRPLHLDDDPREGEHGLAFHILRTNRVVPPWIGVDQEVRARVAEIEALLVRAEAAAAPSATQRAGWHRRLDDLLRAHASAVLSLETIAPSPAQHRLRLDGPTLHARLDDALDRTPEHRP